MSAALEDEIRRRARDFDPPTLIELLRELFPEREIRLRSHPSLGLRPTAIEAIDFQYDKIVVSLNIGLFSTSTPLPSHFRELLAAPRSGAALEVLLERLDERLLKDRIDALRPERSPSALHDPARFRSNILRLAAPASPGTIHRIATYLFPELSISANRSAGIRLLPVDPPRLGYATVGAAALGGHARAPAPTLELVLRTDETTTWRGERWSIEAKRRVDEHLLPVLAGSGVHLTVVLVDLEGAGRLRLKAEGRVGTDPLATGKSPQITVLFEGFPPA
ncbi:MAG: type VI secretion system baseplate subunit TssG [Polyangiaceae bacterium]|nr:type VI secretion system baseplate subunit TssG [Polyangiaceae bacterium]